MSSMEPGKWNNLSCAHTAKKCEEHKLQNYLFRVFLIEERSKQEETKEVCSACFKYLVCFWTKLSAGSASAREKFETKSRYTGSPSLMEKKPDFICCLKMYWSWNNTRIEQVICDKITTHAEDRQYLLDTAWGTEDDHFTASLCPSAWHCQSDSRTFQMNTP